MHGLQSRRIELAAHVRDATVAYDPQWPEARAFDGRIAIGSGGVAVAGDATVFGVRLQSVRVQVPPAGDLAQVRFAAAADAGRMLAFLRAMPERHRLDSLREAWSATGNVAVLASLTMPLGAEAVGLSSIEPTIGVELDLKGADIDLADLGLTFAGMVGRPTALPERCLAIR